MNNLYFLLAFIFMSLAFAIASILAGFIFGYRSKNTDTSSYECGMHLFGRANIKFDIKFLNYAILFLIFDTSLIFLFPFALLTPEIFVLIEVFLFTFILLLALIFSIKKKILRWF